jgi:hypothetical protein
MADDIQGLKDAFGAMLFLEGGLYVMDAFGALNSSPWTSENFGADPVKAQSARYYVMQALIVSNVYSGIAAIISHRIWPLLGSALNSTFLWYTYRNALNRAMSTGATGWRDSSG